MAVIYKITSPSGRVYIGQTINYKSRVRRYENHCCKKQKRLLASLVKYGFHNHIFEIIEECEINLLNERERYWQDFFDVTSAKGLNIRLTHTNDRKGSLSEISKNKISIGNSGNKNGMYGKKISDRAKKIQREKLSGENNYLSKWLLNNQTGIFYPCLREAANSIGMDKRTLWQHINVNKVNKTNFISA
jgi:group I intron endonuclease